MKKIQFKGIKLSQSRKKDEVIETNSSQSEVGNFSTQTETEQKIADTMRENESFVLPHEHCTDENSSTCVINHKKKEKYGLFRNLRRRLRSNFHKNSEETNHIEDVCRISSSKVRSKRHKQSGKCKVNFCTKPSNSNSSQSTESLDMTIHFQRQRKLDDGMWPNKDEKESIKREKPSCKSKDISRFQSTGSSAVDCSSVCKNGAGNIECKCGKKISNVSPRHSSSHIEISVMCHSNGINPGSIGANYYKDHKHIISTGAIIAEVPKVWSLTRELFRLSKFGWYWGPITRREAERKLNGQPDGAFLVRDSSDERYLLSLSFRSYGRTLHTRIEHCNGKFIFDAQPDTEGYPSIVDLIENSMNDPQTGICSYSRHGSPSPPIYPVRLTKPVSRFTQVRSLQYLCRFVIRQNTRYDHIQHLPLPNSIRGWIAENQY